MENLSQKSNVAFVDYAVKAYRPKVIRHAQKALSKQPAAQNFQLALDDLLTRLPAPAGKKSFLVFKHNKYTTVPTENIAFFYVKNESTTIVSFNQQEYAVNHSLEQVQHLLTPGLFFRLNRQYLVSFNAIKEVELYFARKLLVKLAVPAPDKLLVSKEKVSEFLHWLENR